MQSILDALIAQYITPAAGGINPWQSQQQPQMGQPQPVAWNPTQQSGPTPMQQAPQAPQQLQAPTDDIAQALMGNPAVNQTLSAFNQGAAPLEQRYQDATTRRFGGAMGAIEDISDYFREKKLRPEKTAIDARRAQLQQEAAIQAESAKVARREEALLKMGNSPEEARALAVSSIDQDSFDPSKYDKTKPGTLTEDMKRASRRQMLVDNPELTKRIGQEAADKFWLTGNWSEGGTSLSTGPDGSVMFTTGGADPIAIPAKTKNLTDTVTKLYDAEETQADLESIADISKSGFLGYGARGKSFIGGLVDRAGMSDSDIAQFSAERETWANEVARKMLEYRKMITGVAGSPTEMKTIESRILNPKLGKAGFKAEIENEIRFARREANREREKLGLPTIDWPEYEFKFPDEEEDRGIEIAPGVRVREIKK